MTSFLKRFNPFSLTRSRKYGSQQALSEMKPEDIIELNPEDIDLSIESKPADPPLSADKAKALRLVLNMKKYEKDDPALSEEEKQRGRQHIRDKFLGRPTPEETEYYLCRERVLDIRREQARGKYQNAASLTEEEAHDILAVPKELAGEKLITLAQKKLDIVVGGKRKKTKNHRKKKNKTKSKKHRKSEKNSLYKSKRR